MDFQLQQVWHLQENKVKARKDSCNDYDGECQEGTTWESLLIASKHKLDNLILLIDYNKIQALSRLEDALPLNNLSKKIKSFNWDCIEIRNGHSFEKIIPLHLISKGKINR